MEDLVCSKHYGIANLQRKFFPEKSYCNLTSCLSLAPTSQTHTHTHTEHKEISKLAYGHTVTDAANI